MKCWTMSARDTQTLYTWVCYCNEDPSELIYDEKYNELLEDTYNELWDAFGEGETIYPEDWDDLSPEEQDEIFEEDYNYFCENISFEAYEVDTPENFPILIDERNENN